MPKLTIDGQEVEVAAGLTVLHLDKDFELIAAITGDPWESLGTPTD